MKKNFFLTVMALCSIYFAKAQTFNTLRNGGGVNGFASVRQTTDRTGTTITCVGSGYDKCVYTAPPNTPKAASINEAIDYANAQLANGVLSGQVSVEGLPTSWTGTDVNNCSITVEVVPGN